MANILVLGNGGREHTIAWKLHNEGHKILTAPGNAGTAMIGSNYNINHLDFTTIARFVKEEKVDLTIPGPEAPLVAGIVDYFHDKKLPDKGHFIFGPSKEAAKLEGSKIYTRLFCERLLIPQPEFTAYHGTNSNLQIIAAESQLHPHGDQNNNRGIVIKANGLCGGKGVFVCDNYAEARRKLETLKKKGWHDAFVLEELLVGQEVSITAICDGSNIQTLIHSQDHKRRFNEHGIHKHKGDDPFARDNPNTGGMGAYAPTQLLDKALEDEVISRILQPTIRGMEHLAKEPFKGILYAGLMITENKDPYLLEFNVRLGDPETQVILPLLNSSFYEMMMTAIRGELDTIEVKNKDMCAATIVVCHDRYPSGSIKGELIDINKKWVNRDNIHLFHAGTMLKNNQIYTDGGRILSITALGKTHDLALDRAYETLSQGIHFSSIAYRDDIGWQVRGNK